MDLARDEGTSLLLTVALLCASWKSRNRRWGL